jgi:hypothetical protein
MEKAVRDVLLANDRLLSELGNAGGADSASRKARHESLEAAVRSCEEAKAKLVQAQLSTPPAELLLMGRAPKEEEKQSIGGAGEFEVPERPVRRRRRSSILPHTVIKGAMHSGWVVAEGVSVLGMPQFCAAGRAHSVLLSSDGLTFTTGQYWQGQLGHGSSSGNLYSPELVRALLKHQVTQVAAGDEFSLFLTSKGRAYSCGCGKYGQLGHGDTRRQSIPVPIKSNEKLTLSNITMIAAGAFHSLFLVSTGEVRRQIGCTACTSPLIMLPSIHHPRYPLFAGILLWV